MTFDEAYPGVKDILVQHKADESLDPDDEYTKGGSLRAGWPYEGAKMRCGYPSCHSVTAARGYFDLTEAIRKALNEKSGVFETSMVCNGYKGNPRSMRRRNLPRCRNRRNFRFTVVK
jgi:hypothetical protein